MRGQFAVPVRHPSSRADGGDRIRARERTLEEWRESRLLALGLARTEDWQSEETIREEASTGRWAQEEQF